MDFECTLLGSLNFKENRKLGEVMAPDDDDVDRRERGNAYAQPNMTRRGWSEGKRRVHRPYGASLVTRDAPPGTKHCLRVGPWAVKMIKPSCSPSIKYPVFIYASGGVISTLNYHARFLLYDTTFCPNYYAKWRIHFYLQLLEFYFVKLFLSHFLFELQNYDNCNCVCFINFYRVQKYGL